MHNSLTTLDTVPPEAALAGILALLIEARAARPAETRSGSVETLLARAGLTSAAIGALTGQDAGAVETRLQAETEGPALWRTLRRQRPERATAGV